MPPRKWELDVYTKLRKTEIFFRKAGREDISQHVGQILASQNEIQAFCEALKSDGFFIRHLDKADKTYDERREFFSKFQLASDRVEKLASITRAWKSDRVTVNGLTVSAQLWSEDPKCFWFGYSTDQNIIRRCLHDFNHAHTTNIIRQIIYLTILQKEVEKEQSRIDNSNVRRRSRKKGPVDRNGEFLTISLKNIAVRLWPDRDERVRNRRILQQRSLHGYKLNKLKPSGIKLALPPESLQRFSRQKWTEAEYEAINSFIQTLPQYNEREMFEKAWTSITSYYYTGSNLTAQSLGHREQPERRDVVSTACSPLDMLSRAVLDNRLSPNPNENSLTADKNQQASTEGVSMEQGPGDVGSGSSSASMSTATGHQPPPDIQIINEPPSRSSTPGDIPHSQEPRFHFENTNAALISQYYSRNTAIESQSLPDVQAAWTLSAFRESDATRSSAADKSQATTFQVEVMDQYTQNQIFQLSQHSALPVSQMGTQLRMATHGPEGEPSSLAINDYLALTNQGIQSNEGSSTPIRNIPHNDNMTSYPQTSMVSNCQYSDETPVELYYDLPEDTYQADLYRLIHTAPFNTNQY